jgi:hypothetical protein
MTIIHDDKNKTVTLQDVSLADIAHMATSKLIHEVGRECAVIFSQLSAACSSMQQWDEFVSMFNQKVGMRLSSETIQLYRLGKQNDIVALITKK